MPNPPNNRPKGILGESIAAAYLQKKGYRLIARNFTIRGGELDLIATHQNTLVFIEVKTRSGTQFGTAEEAITPWKLRALIKTAQFFSLQQPKLPKALRIDLVAVHLSQFGELEHIEHIENITG